MYYIHRKNAEGTKYSVVDTNDGSEEWFTPDEIKSYIYAGAVIQGVNKRTHQIRTIAELFDYQVYHSSLFDEGLSYRLSRNNNNYDFIELVGIEKTANNNNIAIPDFIISIPEYFFSGKDFRSVFISNNVKTMGIGCFENCVLLQFIKFSDSLSVIPDNCCRGCISLKRVYIMPTTTYIGDNAFANCPFVILKIPANSSLVFDDMTLSRIGLTSDNIEYLGDYEEDYYE